MALPRGPRVEVKGGDAQRSLGCGAHGEAGHLVAQLGGKVVPWGKQGTEEALGPAGGARERAWLENRENGKESLVKCTNSMKTGPVYSPGAANLEPLRAG